MKRKLGFSIIEILIALVILSLGFLPIYNLFRQGTATTMHNVQEITATNYASDMINFCKDLKYYQLDSIVEKNTLVLENDEEIKNFFLSKLGLNTPPAVVAPFTRSLTLERFNYTFDSFNLKKNINSLKQWFKELLDFRKKVNSFKVKVVINFPRMSGKGNDDVTIYSIIMD